MAYIKDPDGKFAGSTKGGATGTVSISKQEKPFMLLRIERRNRRLMGGVKFKSSAKFPLNK